MPVLLLSVLIAIMPSIRAQEAATGTFGMAATAHPLATQTAVSILKQGGNAIDAAVAAAFVVGVVEPDGSGLGGGGGMVIYLREEKRSCYINYYPRASERGSESGYSGSKDAHTAKAVCVPGTVAGLVLAHEQFGALPLGEVIAPAIELAEKGFPIDSTLAKIILDNIETIFADETTTSVFCRDGFPMMEGDTIIQSELAKTLACIAAEGKKGFYDGPLTASLVKGIAERGGVLTLSDFRNYEAEMMVPLTGSYRGYGILTANAPQSGLCLLEALNLLENIRFKKAGHYSESAATLDQIADMQRLMFADRAVYLGDPDFYAVPVDGLISKKYAKTRYREMMRDPQSLLPSSRIEAGNPSAFMKGEIPEDAGISDPGEYGGHTTHLSVIDKDGNCVSLTQTLGLFFGSGQTVNGVLLNCAMTNFSTRPESNNKYADGKQPVSSIMPTIVLDGADPLLVAGTPGAARIITTLIELLVNVIDFDMEVSRANLAPRFYVRDNGNQLYLESGISEEVQSELSEMGYEIKVYKGIDLFFGGAQLIYVDPKTGRYYGTADKRRGGVALGY